MTNPMKTCKACGSETKVTTLESFGGEEAPVTVTVEGMPAVVCAKNHKRFLNPGFVAQVMDFVADPAKIAPQPPAVKRGLLKKHYHCSDCGAELLASSSLTSERARCKLQERHAVQDHGPGRALQMRAMWTGAGAIQR